MQRPPDYVPELTATVTHKGPSGAGRTAGRVGRLDELDVLVRPEHEPLPRHARIDGHGRPTVCALHGWTRRGDSGCPVVDLRRGFSRGRIEEHLVHRHPELGRERIERAHGRL